MEYHILVWDDVELNWLVNICAMLKKIRPNWSQRFCLMDNEIINVVPGLKKDVRELLPYKKDDDCELVFEIYHSRGAETVDFMRYCCLITDVRLDKSWTAANKKYLMSSYEKLTQSEKERYGFTVLSKKFLENNSDASIIIASNYFYSCQERLEIMQNGEGNIVAVLNKTLLKQGDDSWMEHVSHIIMGTILRWKKKIRNEELESKNQQLEKDNKELRRQVTDERDLIGTSTAITKVKERIQIVAPTDITVLIRGESGTGKEVVAREIHKKSSRHAKSFVARNMACISPTIADSELFGHVKGAFTGATKDKIGIFEQAKGGTIFLDEIGKMSKDLQVKLLRVIQEKVFQKVGGNGDISANIRIIAATNQNLEELIENEMFYSDLYHRLKVCQIFCPPLKDRLEDIPLFVEHFIPMFAIRYNKSVSNISLDALAFIKNYNWSGVNSGNIRELENIVRMAVVWAKSSTITLDDITKAIYVPPSESQNAVSCEQSPNVFTCKLTGIQIDYKTGILANQFIDEIANGKRQKIEPALICPRIKKKRKYAENLGLPTDNSFGWAFLLLWYCDYWIVGGGEQKNLPQVKKIFDSDTVNSIWRKVRDTIKVFIKENNMPDRNPKADNIKNEYGLVFSKWLKSNS